MDAASIFIKFLQACITPVAMISGVGLLLLTITNRMARVVDRIRQLVKEYDSIGGSLKLDQIRIFYRRSELLRNSVAWIMIGMISSCMIIPLLFVMSFFPVDLRIAGYILFLISITSMLISFVYFFRDVLSSLRAIKLETKHLL
jgi:hypothetical protein